MDLAKPPTLAFVVCIVVLSTLKAYSAKSRDWLLIASFYSMLFSLFPALLLAAKQASLVVKYGHQNHPTEFDSSFTVHYPFSTACSVTLSLAAIYLIRLYVVPPLEETA